MQFDKVSANVVLLIICYVEPVYTIMRLIMYTGTIVLTELAYKMDCQDRVRHLLFAVMFLN